MNVLFLGKKNDPHCAAALAFVRANFRSVRVHMGEWGDPFPANDWSGDFIISYLSRWVVPRALLTRARIAINFHSGSPAYPGIGCTNFALYEGAEEYGSTCHFMAPKVDTGPIIATSMFPLFPSDDVASLLQRTYAHQLVLFYDIVGRIIRGIPLKLSGEQWTRQPFTRAELDEISTLTPDMDSAEIARRERATTFGHWRPKMRA